MKIIRLLIIAVIFLALCYAGAYYYSLTKIELTDVRINEISDFTTESFRINGNAILHNNGLISIKISKVDYDITLESTKQRLGSGSIIGQKIEPDNDANFGFATKLKWAPSAETIIQLAKQDKVYLVVNGTAYIGSGIFEIKSPFSEKVDIKPYIEKTMKSKITDLVDKVSAIFGK